MDFSKIIGQQHLKSHLLKTIENGRIPHTQLFVGKTGSGILPIALSYAKQVLCHKYTIGSDEYQSCESKVIKMVHPDLHFVFPVNTNDQIKKNPVSSHFLSEWRNFILKNPYASLFDWYQFIGIENKQGNISKFEAIEISKNLSLKPYEGGYQVMIIWMADKMNTECSNKILKLVEEPPKKTVLLLLTENEERVLGTIESRCQKLHFPLLSETDIFSYLVDIHSIAENKAKKISHQANGDLNKALHLISNNEEDIIFEKWFLSWVRTAFRAKKNKSSINDLIIWSEMLAKEGRETKKKFLGYCLEIFRQAMLKNYRIDALLFIETKDKQFSLEKFAPYVHQNNIYKIMAALEDAEYHIERNGNAKIIFTDLSIKLTRLIHTRE